MKTSRHHRRSAWAASILAVLGTAAAGAADGPVDFTRYEVILERKPFGAAPPQPAGPPPGSELAVVAGFAKGMRVSSMWQVEEGMVQVGIVDDATKSSYLLGVGESSEDGLKVLAADLATGEVQVSKGTETETIELAAGPAAKPTSGRPGSPSSRGGPTPPPQGRMMSYMERRHERDQQRETEQKPPTPPPPQPRLTGKELEKHLQEYQMEVIRKGMPPLPVPLTPEMDAQLVREGVLPPSQ